MISIRTMRAVDYWIGLPVTALLSVVHGLLRPWRRVPSGAAGQVCFIELSEAGSTVLAYSAVRRLQSHFPGVRVSWLIFRQHAEGLSLLNVIPPDRILTIRTDCPLHFLGDTVRVLAGLRRSRVDTVIDLELFSRFTSILSYLSGARRRVGFHRGHNEGLFRGTYLTHGVFYNPGIHISLNFHALVDALQVPSPVCVPAVKTLLPATETEVARVPLAPADRQCGVRILRGAFPQYAPDRHLVVLLNPNAGALPLRAWPVARFAELAGRLVRHAPQVLVGVVGLPEASHEADIIVQAAASDRCASLVGRTRNLGELVTLCHLSRVLVTNDSGPAHFATLTPIRVVALFGPETPRLYGPLGETAVCLYAGLSCSPCFSAANHRSSPCRDNLCLQAISVTEVWQTLARWLPSAAETAVAGDGGDRG